MHRNAWGIWEIPVKGELPGLEITIIGDASADPRSQHEKDRILEVMQRRGLEGCTTLLGYPSHRVYFEQAYKHHLFISPVSEAGRKG